MKMHLFNLLVIVAVLSEFVGGDHCSARRVGLQLCEKNVVGRSDARIAVVPGGGAVYCKNPNLALVLCNKGPCHLVTFGDGE